MHPIRFQRPVHEGDWQSLLSWLPSGHIVQHSTHDFEKYEIVKDPREKVEREEFRPLEQASLWNPGIANEARVH